MTRDEERKKLKEELDELLAGPIPRNPPKPKPPEAEVVPFNPWPIGRAWSPGDAPASPYVTINYAAAELQRAVAEAARAARRAADPYGIGLYGHHETMAEIVARQNGDDDDVA